MERKTHTHTRPGRDFWCPTQIHSCGRDIQLARVSVGNRKYVLLNTQQSYRRLKSLTTTTNKLLIPRSDYKEKRDLDFTSTADCLDMPSRIIGLHFK